MAARDEIIRIVVQALYRGGRDLKEAERDIDRLERKEKQASRATDAMATSEERLARESAETNKQLRLLRANREDLVEKTRRGTTATDDLAEATREFRDATREASAEQLTFFERTREGNRLLSQRSDLLRDIILRDTQARPLLPDFERQRTRQGVQGQRGRFVAAPLFPLGAEEVKQPDLYVRQRSLFKDFSDQQNLARAQARLARLAQIRDETRIAQILDEQARTLRRQEIELLKRQRETLEFARELRQIRSQQVNIGDIDARTRNILVAQEINRLRRLREEATSFEERDLFDAQVEKLLVFNQRLGDARILLSDLTTLGDKFDISGISTRDVDRLAVSLESARNQSARLGDALGERGAMGRARSTVDQLTARMDQRLAPAISKVATGLQFLARAAGISNVELERSRKTLQDREKSLLDISQFDETVSAGLRRLSRLLVIVGALVPFLITGFGVLVGAVTALAGGVAALAGAFSQLAGVAAALPTLLTAIVAPIVAFNTVVGPGIRNITDRFKEAIQVQDSARKQTTENAVAIGKAQQAAADAARDASEQIADQQRAINETRRRGAEQVEDQERSLARLRVRNGEQERDLVRDIRRAKREAAEDARDAEKDYQEVVARNRVDEREIAQELSKRRATLGSLRLQGADPAAIGAAEAAVAGSQEQLRRTRVENRREEETAFKRVTEARVEGAERVSDLERQLARTKRDNLQQEGDAERQLFRTRRDNAAQLLQQERQLARTRRDATEAQAAAVAALAETQRKARGDLTDTFSGLEPAERRVATQLVRIREEWLRLTRVARERGLDLIGDALTFVEGRLPQLAARATQFSNALVRIGREGLARFTRPEALGRVNRILDDALGITNALGDAVLDLADGFLIVADHARPVATHIGQIFRELGASARAAAQRGEASGGLDSFFAGTNRVLDLTIDILKELGGALFDVLRIGAPFGEILLGDLLEWTEGVGEFTDTRAPAIRAFFRDSVPVVRELAGLLSDVVRELFIFGRELIRPDAEGNVFLLDVIRGIRGGLPGFREFIQELTIEGGPKIIQFLEALGRFVGVLIGPNGAFIVLLDVMTTMFTTLGRLGDEVEALVITFFAFGGIITSLSAKLKAFLILATLRAAGGTKGGGIASIFAGVSGGLPKLAIAALITLPGLLEKITAGIDKVAAAVGFFFAPLDKLFSLLGAGDGVMSNFLFQLAALELAFRLLAGRSLLALLGNLRTFIKLMRESQRATIAGRFLEALMFSFARLSDFVLIAIRRLRAWIQAQREAQRQNRALATSNFLVGFSELASSIAAAARALAAYVRGARAARNANIALAASNTAVGATGLFAAGSGLGGLLTRLGAFVGTIRVISRGVIGLLPRFVRLAGVVGLVVGALEGVHRLQRLVFGESFLDVLDDWTQGMRDWVNDATGGIFGVSLVDVIRDRFGQAGEESAEALSNPIGDAVVRLGRKLNAAVDAAQAKVDQWVAKMEAVGQGISAVGSSIGGFIAGRMSQTPVPAQQELDRIQRAETLRQRRITRQTADDELREAQRLFARNQRALAAAQSRAQRREARRGIALSPAQRAAHLRESGGEGLELTREQKRRQAAQERARREDRQRIRDRQREVSDAHKTVVEVAARRKETYRAVALEERQERLATLAAIQERERALEIAAATRRAESAYAAYEEATKKGGKAFANARKNLISVLGELGVAPKDTKAWLAGRKTGNDFGSGLIAALNQLGKAFRLRIIIEPIKATGKGLLGREGGGRAAGGAVPGQEGAAVPIMAHAGEWVLNRSQQTRAAMMAGLDRTLLERALFHRLSVQPRIGYAMGGVVRSSLGGGASTQFLTPISIQTTSPTVDAEYVGRALESRLRAVV